MEICGARDVKRAGLRDTLQRSGTSASCGISLASWKLWYSGKHLLYSGHLLVDTILEHFCHFGVSGFPSSEGCLPGIVSLLLLLLAFREESVRLFRYVEILSWESKFLL